MESVAPRPSPLQSHVKLVLTIAASAVGAAAFILALAALYAAVEDVSKLPQEPPPYGGSYVPPGIATPVAYSTITPIPTATYDRVSASKTATPTVTATEHVQLVAVITDTPKPTDTVAPTATELPTCGTATKAGQLCWWKTPITVATAEPTFETCATPKPAFACIWPEPTRYPTFTPTPQKAGL